MGGGVTEDIENLDSRDRVRLGMEELIEERIRIDKEVCADLERDWEELYDGECGTCGRAYEAAYLMTEGYPVDPHEQRPAWGDCIPCWREQNDIPKLDTELSP
jgi:hypothetical protein